MLGARVSIRQLDWLQLLLFWCSEYEMPLLPILWVNIAFAIELASWSSVDDGERFHIRGSLEVKFLILWTIWAHFWKIRLVKHQCRGLIDYQDFIFDFKDLLDWSWELRLNDQILLLHDVDSSWGIRERTIRIDNVFNDFKLLQRELTLTLSQNMHHILPPDWVWASGKVNQFFTIFDLDICLTNFLEDLKSRIQFVFGYLGSQVSQKDGVHVDNLVLMLSHDLVQDLQNVLLFGFVAKCHLIVGQLVHKEACILIQLDKLSQVINFVG